jgi:hypothetical protein
MELELKKLSLIDADGGNSSTDADSDIDANMKEYVYTGTPDQLLAIEMSRRALYEPMSMYPVKSTSSLSEATWRPDGEILITRSKGSLITTMGRSNGRGGMRLLPEEALFLMECFALVIWHQGAPMSLKECYHQLSNHDAYVVYKYLKRLGYILVRYQLGWHDLPSDDDKEDDGVFWVWKPQHAFSKTRPPLPYCILIIAPYYQNPIDTFERIQSLRSSHPNTPIAIAITHNGSTSFHQSELRFKRASD